MGIPAFLAILSALQGLSGDEEQEPIEQEQKYGGYGANSTNVPPGTIRSVNDNSGLYKTTGQIGQQRSVQPYQYRKWDAGTQQYQPGGEVPRDRRTETDGGGGGSNASGVMGLITNILGSNDQQQNQAYQMPYLRR